MQISLKTKIHSWLARFVQIQLFLSLISLPFLVAWGLPISVLAPLGNLIFSPFLALFLTLACAIFFSEILHLPNGWLVVGLEQVTHLWTWLIQLPGKKWLVGFPQPAWWVLGLIPLSALLILHWRKTNSVNRSIFWLAALFVGFCLYLKLWCTPGVKIEQIPCNKGHVTLIKNHATTILVDPGVIGQRLSAPTWIEYTLRSHLMKSVGALHVDHLFVLQPGKLTFEAVEQLVEKLEVKRVYLVLWRGYFPYREWRSFAQLKKVLEEKKIPLIRIGSAHGELTMAHNEKLTIMPLQKEISHSTVTFPALSVECCVDNQHVTIYSAKHKKHFNHSYKEKNALR